MTYPPPPGSPQPYGYPSPPAGPQRLRGRTPRRLGWIFLAVGVVLIVIGGIILETKSYGKVDGFQRVTIAQGSGTVELDGTGKWVGYYEASNVTDSIDRIPGLSLQLTDPSGQVVPFEPYGNRSDGKIDKLTYDKDGHRGAAAIQFTVNTPGRYQVRIQAEQSLPAGAVIAFGRDIGGGATVGGLLAGIGALFVIAAIVLLIVGFVKRRRHKRELQAPAYYQAPAQYGAPPPYGAPPVQGPPPGAAPPPPGWGPPQS